jgi:urocanate hydratase
MFYRTIERLRKGDMPMINNSEISKAMTVRLEDICEQLPDPPEFEVGIRRAPKRNFRLSQTETALALKNALRYASEKWHSTLAPEFLDELLTRGRI